MSGIKNHLNKQSGETIVEVLLAITVVMFTLSLGYGLSRRSLKAVRKSEERAQSVQFAQQQIERFKQYLQNNPTITTKKPATNGGTPILTDGNSGFCFYDNPAIPGADISIRYVSTGSSAKDPLCALNSSGQYFCEQASNPCGSTPPTSDQTDSAGYFYRAGIGYFPELGQAKQDQFYAAAGVFSVGDTANSLGFDVVTIPYRIHQ
ncbi:MAG: type II secretion system protein [Patescibacteria group bacterium]